MFQYFYPHDYKDSTYEINFEEYYKKGYRGVLFDIDNTLVMHGADADEKAEQLFRELKKIGFSTCLISNNKEERVKRFNKNIRTKYIFKAGKPLKKNYKTLIKHLNKQYIKHHFLLQLIYHFHNMV